MDWWSEPWLSNNLNPELPDVGEEDEEQGVALLPSPTPSTLLTCEFSISEQKAKRKLTSAKSKREITKNFGVRR